MPWPDYRPIDITPPELTPARIAAAVAEGWAEPETDPRSIDYRPRQAAALIGFEVVDGLPRNPTGRTGKCGRNLGYWAENAAADPIVVASTPDGGRLVLLIRRADCGQWAIPGGMVDPGETAPAALTRELHEEAGINLTSLTPRVLTRTYVDDPRNSDHAWVASTVALYQLAEPIEPTAGDDATAAAWWPFGNPDSLHAALDHTGAQLYPPHAGLLTLAHLHLLQDARKDTH